MYLLLFFFFVLVLTFVLLWLGVSSMVSDSEIFIKWYNLFYECSYECGPMSSGFSLQFYVVGLSFLLFDLEICLFTPYVSAYLLSGLFMKFGVVFLVLVLFLLIYEFFCPVFLNFF